MLKDILAWLPVGILVVWFVISQVRTTRRYRAEDKKMFDE